MNIRKVISFFFVVCLLWSAPQAAYPLEEGKLLERKAKDYEIWQQGFLRVFFQREGEFAVDPTDANNNNCPDYVEDLAAQILVTHTVLHDMLAFPHPLESARYKDVSYIDVLILNKDKLQGHQGSAAEDPRNSKEFAASPPDLKYEQLPKVKRLLIRINRALDPKVSLTPSHEYFHMIQYASSHIKNRFYLEGMAVWSKDILAKPKPNQRLLMPEQAFNLFKLLDSPSFQKELLAVPLGSHANRMLWFPLAQLCPATSYSLPLDSPVLAERYSDGSPVLQDEHIMGVFFMREVLHELAALDETAFRENGFESWSEENQRHDKNLPYVITAMKNAQKKLCPELR